ncbi:hypothetical protein [Treponema sp. J25]|uniref:hypothetical protein n=1 Tax=Treponema sp. J25 TaxID=2094121 RepID=UPI00104D7AA5|nr:hypothetical protein [Treponema sp. J25]MCX7656078.1 hypothetical protein [Treponemataceae bacterium]TCW60254.1 hypothetical protein C5O22_12465 [Treponema sp. J25]
MVLRSLLKGISTIFWGVLLVITINGCSKPESEQYKEIKKAYQKDPQNQELLESLLMLELLERDNAAQVIRLYEQNKDLLSGRVMAGVYYATALCKMAGESKTPSLQLKYVRAGMHEFELLTEKWPNEGRVYLWQAITYSNFPVILGADKIVQSIIEMINQKIASQEWIFAVEELKQLVYAYVNLAREYKSLSYLDSARMQAEKTGLNHDTQIQTVITKAAEEIK